MHKADLLVVEDDPALARLVSYNLEKQGYMVRHAADGEAALEYVRQRRPDLILLDWMLPGISGLEVCRRLREQARTAALPIIMFSARGEEADAIRGLDTGADDYLSSPLAWMRCLPGSKPFCAGLPRPIKPCGLIRWSWTG